MTEKDIVKLFVILTAAYPRFDTFSNRDTARPVIQLWTEMLADVSPEVTETAVKKLILESPYPPTIADVRQRISEIMNPDNQMSAAEAWGEVMHAIREYGYYRTNAAMQSLSPLTRTVVQQIGWSEINMSEEPDVIRGQFRMMYEQVAKRKKQETLLPPRLKETIRQIGNGGNIKALERGITHKG